MVKRCSLCKEEKAHEDFHRNKRLKSGRHSWCKACSSKRAKRYDADAFREKKYGIKPEDYWAMALEQGGCCAICGNTVVPLHVDHNHETKQVRGLLCGGCNRMLGLAHDDAAVLIAASEYLKERS